MSDLDSLPEPMVAECVDLRDFSFTPMFRSRLFGSSFHAQVTDSGWRAGVTLWLKSWDQMPAGTLPDNEVDLCRLAELGRDVRTWRKVAKEALWGWVKCADGRLHHKTVAQGVNEAWVKKQQQRSRTDAARAALAARKAAGKPTGEGQRQSATDTFQASVTESVTDPATNLVADIVTSSKGQGQCKGREKEKSFESEATETLSVPSERTARRYARNQYTEDFLAFWSAYPTDPNMSKKEAYEVWVRLPDVEREEAMKALPAYNAYRRANPDLKTIHACRFLSKRRAEGYLEVAEKVAKAQGVYVKQGTPQWDAWTTHRGGRPAPTDRDGGWHFESEWPPRQTEAVH